MSASTIFKSPSIFLWPRQLLPSRPAVPTTLPPCTRPVPPGSRMSCSFMGPGLTARVGVSSSARSTPTVTTSRPYNCPSPRLPTMSRSCSARLHGRWEDGKTLLIGYSYGGVVITEAGVDPKVAGLVYLSAFAPDAGESALALNGTVAPTPIGADFVPDTQGFLKISDAGIAADFART